MLDLAVTRKPLSWSRSAPINAKYTSASSPSQSNSLKTLYHSSRWSDGGRGSSNRKLELPLVETLVMRATIACLSQIPQRIFRYYDGRRAHSKTLDNQRPQGRNGP